MALSVMLASALPARADDNDDLLAALAAIALLGVIINEADNDTPSYNGPNYQEPYHPPQPYPYPSYVYPPRGVGLPAACAIEVQTRDRGRVVIYAESCLNRYGLRHLPDRCGREIRVGGRHEWIYGQHCLRDAGYWVESATPHDRERPD